MPNIENLIKVRDFIKEHANQFDYTTVLRRDEDPIHKPLIECGTVGCVAGFTRMFFDPFKQHRDSTLGYAEEKLELTQEEHIWLFFPWDCEGIYHKAIDYTVDDALDRIDHLIKGLPISEYNSPHAT